MQRVLVRHWSMAEQTPQPTVPVPPATEIASSLPEEAVRYDPANPPVSGSVQRNPADQPG
jgi:hypothetical protein